MNKSEFILESNVIEILKRNLPFNIPIILIKKKLELLGAKNIVMVADGDSRSVKLTCSAYKSQSDSINKYLDTMRIAQ